MIWSQVIFILSFDPFGEDRIVYTIRNQCVELPEMEYNDGATTKFLYINGEKGDASEGMRELLHFIGDSTAEFAVNPELRRIHSYIEEVKKDPAVKEAYMKFEEYVERERREAAREAVKEEKARADSERARADVAEAKIAELMDLLKINGIPLPE